MCAMGLCLCFSVVACVILSAVRCSVWRASVRSSKVERRSRVVRYQLEKVISHLLPPSPVFFLSSLSCSVEFASRGRGRMPLAQ